MLLIMKIDSQKVCMITTRHLPGDPRVFEKEARFLKSIGYKVDIVLPYGELPKNTYGINFIFFKKAKFPFRKLSSFINAYKKSKSSGAKIIHCHEVDISLLVGFFVKVFNRNNNIKLIFDCHEFFLRYLGEHVPQLLRGFFYPIFIIYEKFILKYCDHIITANIIEQSYYQILFPTKKITVVYNVPHLDNNQKSMYEKNKNLYDLCYEGYLNDERGLKILLPLVKRIKCKYKSIKLVIVGYIPQGQFENWANAYIKENNLIANIHITGWQSYDNIHKYHKMSKIGIFLYQYSSANNILAGPPNKLFNFMKAGLPIVGSDLPETTRILEECECGIPVTPHSLEEIESAVMSLLTNEELRMKMGSNAMKAFKSKYNWNYEQKKIKRIYDYI